MAKAELAEATGAKPVLGRRVCDEARGAAADASGRVRGTALNGVSGKILFGGLAAWFSRGVSILLSLVLMPVLFRHLSRDELGVWLLLGQSGAALGIFDFGFGLILTRRIAFTLARFRATPHGDLTAEGRQQLSDLIATGARVYRCLALFGFAVSLAVGAACLNKLELAGIGPGVTWGAWAILCLGQAVGIWSAVWTCLLQGMGYVGWDGILAGLVNCLILLCQILAVCLGGGVVSLAALTAIGALSQRGLFLRFLRRERATVLPGCGHWRSDLFRPMVSPAVRAWLTSLGYLLLANTDQFFIAAHQGAAAIPAYRAAFLLVINLHLLSGVFSNASSVFVSHLWEAGELTRIRSILRRNSQLGLLAMACGAAAILALGPALFDAWLGAGNFVGYPVLLIFLATFFLEHHANVFSTCGRATDDEAYAGWSVAAGLLKVGLALLLTGWLGLAGLALSTLIAQGLTNDWFMVYRSARRLGVGLGEHARAVLVPVALAFGGVLGLSIGLDSLLAGKPAPVRVGMVSSVAASVLVGTFWHVTFDPKRRGSALSRLWSSPLDLLRWKVLNGRSRDLERNSLGAGQGNHPV